MLSRILQNNLRRNSQAFLAPAVRCYAQSDLASKNLERSKEFEGMSLEQLMEKFRNTKEYKNIKSRNMKEQKAINARVEELTSDKFVEKTQIPHIPGDHPLSQVMEKILDTAVQQLPNDHPIVQSVEQNKGSSLEGRNNALLEALIKLSSDDFIQDNTQDLDPVVGNEAWEEALDMFSPDQISQMSTQEIKWVLILVHLANQEDHSTTHAVENWFKKNFRQLSYDEVMNDILIPYYAYLKDFTILHHRLTQQLPPTLEALHGKFWVWETVEEALMQQNLETQQSSLIGRPLTHYVATAYFLYNNGKGSENILQITSNQKNHQLDSLFEKRINLGIVSIPKLGPGKDYWKIKFWDNFRHLYNVMTSRVPLDKTENGEKMVFVKDLQGQSRLPLQWKDDIIEKAYQREVNVAEYVDIYHKTVQENKLIDESIIEDPEEREQFKQARLQHAKNALRLALDPHKVELLGSQYYIQQIRMGMEKYYSEGIHEDPKYANKTDEEKQKIIEELKTANDKLIEGIEQDREKFAKIYANTTDLSHKALYKRTIDEVTCHI